MAKKKSHALKKKLGLKEFYCLMCKKRRVGKNIKVSSAKNYKVGKVPMLKAKCPKCDCKMNKFVKREDVDYLKTQF
jgi:hypothetical protein